MKNYILLFILISYSNFGQKTDLTLLETLHKTDTLGIYHSSVGTVGEKCGVRTSNKIKVFYLNDKLVAQTKKGEEIIMANVDESQRNFLIALEKESHSYDDPSKVCSMSEGYWYYINSELKFRVIDQTCEWHGFEQMTNKLFGFK